MYIHINTASDTWINHWLQGCWEKGAIINGLFYPGDVNLSLQICITKNLYIIYFLHFSILVQIYNTLTNKGTFNLVLPYFLPFYPSVYTKY